jgi:hypothetical protein
MKTPARILPVSLTALMLFAASASAAQRAVLINDGVDNQDTAPSLTQKAATREVTSAAVTYQDGGQVTASVTYNLPFDDESDASVLVVLDGAAQCDNSSGGPPELRLRLATAPDFNTYPPGPPASYATLEGYDSSVTAATQVSADRRMLSATFSNLAFANRDYRCAAGRDDSPGGSDQFSGYFEGFAPQRMVPEDVTAAMEVELAKRYGQRWTRGTGKWSVCPKEEVGQGEAEDGSDAFGLCEFRFKDGAKWRHGSMSFKLVNGYLDVDYFGSNTFIKTLRTCHIRRNLKGYAPEILDRHLRADGFVSCYDGAATMIRDVHYLKPGVGRVGFHGTNRAGFEAADAFRCVVRARSGGRRTARCANGLGDRFIYSYITRAKPRKKARPKSQAHSSCDSNYSGMCLRPNASDYDCAGGSGDGPYYVQGPITVVGEDHYGLDADGDGTACE